ncbi:MAG: methylated-DNA--protein-cysteine methyltransferase [Verrucomicrobiaceae bacterium]|nr:methylated-DNA--protein-cysteine methyltransferase [Verrucomicrobiaceae bacterium]
MNTLHHTYYESPLGRILLTGTATHLRGLFFIGQKRERPVPPGSIQSDAPFATVLSQLDDYFAGKPVHFDVPLEMEGTPFQQTVWRALQAIPRGQTITYGQLARNIGSPSAVRAVALANACNRISVIIPCHRVIGANGTLTGYAGGLDKKRWLLDVEAGGVLPGLAAK